VDRNSCSLEEELELFIEDRRRHVQELIGPQLRAGSVVLTDRYYFSTAAYQGAAGMNVESIFARNSFAPVPDLVILLTMDPEVSIARIREGRGEELNDFEQLDQLKKVAAYFARFSDSCIHRIDAAAELHLVQDQVRQAVVKLFEERKYSCP
jgi:dTMP kinase